jgi:hypothetical protein
MGDDCGFFMATIFLRLNFGQELQRGFACILKSELFQVLIICLFNFSQAIKRPW